MSDDYYIQMATKLLQEVNKSLVEIIKLLRFLVGEKLKK